MSHAVVGGSIQKPNQYENKLRTFTKHLKINSDRNRHPGNCHRSHYSTNTVKIMKKTILALLFLVIIGCNKK